MPPERAELQRLASLFGRLRFDEAAYLAANGDLAFMAGDTEALIRHFFEHGAAEGRRLIVRPGDSDVDLDAECAAISRRPGFVEQVRTALSAALRASGQTDPFPPLHKLAHQPRPFARRAEVAVLVRTHVVDEKFHDLVGALTGAARFDLFVLLDCTHRRFDLAMPNVIPHAVSDCAGMGLPHDANGLFWRCGDIPLYIAHTRIPDYAHYVMIEVDVHFRKSGLDYMNRLADRLSERDPCDGIFLNYRAMPRDEAAAWPYARCALDRFDKLHYGYFPVVILSNRAIRRMFVERQLERAGGKTGDDLVMCEAFAPSCLVAAGLSCADLNTILPGSYDRALMGFNHQAEGRLSGLPLGFTDTFAQQGEMIHSVYARDDFLARNLKLAGMDRERLRFFIDTVSSGRFPSLPAAALEASLRAARERLDGDVRAGQ